MNLKKCKDKVAELKRMCILVNSYFIPGIRVVATVNIRSGVVITSPCKESFVMILLIVPPKPSQGPFPSPVAKKCQSALIL